MASDLESKIVRIWEAYGSDRAIDTSTTSDLARRVLTGDLAAPGRGLPEIRKYFATIRSQEVGSLGELGPGKRRPVLISMAIEYRERVVAVVALAVVAWLVFTKRVRVPFVS